MLKVVLCKEDATPGCVDSVLQNNVQHGKNCFRQLYSFCIYSIITYHNSTTHKNFICVVEHLSLIERFITGKETSHEDVIKLYASDFDGDKFQLHMYIFLDVAKSRKGAN